MLLFRFLIFFPTASGIELLDFIMGEHWQKGRAKGDKEEKDDLLLSSAIIDMALI